MAELAVDFGEETAYTMALDMALDDAGGFLRCRGVSSGGRPKLATMAPSIAVAASMIFWGVPWIRRPSGEYPIAWRAERATARIAEPGEARGQDGWMDELLTLEATDAVGSHAGAVPGVVPGAVPGGSSSLVPMGPDSTPYAYAGR